MKNKIRSFKEIITESEMNKIKFKKIDSGHYKADNIIIYWDDNSKK